MNNLYNLLGGIPVNNNMQIVQEFIKFKNGFTGDPKEEVEKLVRTGKISQSQLNHIQQMAMQFQKLLK